MRRLAVVRRLLAQPTLRTSVLIAAGGISVMLANLLYANLLTPEGFGRLVLVQAVASVGVGLLPLGFDALIVRKELAAPLRVAGIVLALGSTVGLLAVWLAHVGIGVDSGFALIALGAGIAGAAARFFAAIDQSDLKFMRSQLVSQAPFVSFLGAAALHHVVGLSSWQEAGLALAASYGAAAALGYFFVRGSDGAGAPKQGAPWLSALAFLGIVASLSLLNQMERLMAGALLGMAQVGALGLATTLVASPFRLLSAGIGYTVTPRLKHCADKAERRRLLMQEFLFSMAIGLPGAVVLLLIVPPLIETLYGDKYTVAWSLILALTALGLVRLNSGVVSAAMNALGDTRTLHAFNIAGWIVTAAAGAAAWALSGYGAAGVVAGVTAGWILRIVCAGWLIRKAL